MLVSTNSSNYTIFSICVHLESSKPSFLSFSSIFICFLVELGIFLCQYHHFAQIGSLYSILTAQSLLLSTMHGTLNNRWMVSSGSAEGERERYWWSFVEKTKTIQRKKSLLGLERMSESLTTEADLRWPLLGDRSSQGRKENKRRRFSNGIKFVSRMRHHPIDKSWSHRNSDHTNSEIMEQK